MIIYLVIAIVSLFCITLWIDRLVGYCFTKKRHGLGFNKNTLSKKNNSNSLHDHDNSKNLHDNIINKFMMSYGKPIKSPYIIGICGASGSGKTFIANLIAKTIGKIYTNTKCSNVTIIGQDSYYIGGNSETNYDEPMAIDFDYLISHLMQLLAGIPIECPCYDFTTHSRLDKTITIYPTEIIIVEGILIFTQEKLIDLFNMKIFIDANPPTQFFRRTIRDIKERGRDIEEVRERYERDVWPSYIKYVKRSAKYADIIINNTNDCYGGLQVMLNHIITILDNICGK